MSLNVLNFMQQMDEIYFIIGVKKYTNGIDFHCFHGGKFLPCQIVSGIDDVTLSLMANKNN